MLRKQAVSFLKQVPKLCEGTANEITREGIPALTGRLQSVAGHQLSPARDIASSSPRCSFSGSPSGPATSRLGAARSAAPGAADSISGSGETPMSFLTRLHQGLENIPKFPKLLGFAGALPFLSLAPPMVESLGFPDLVDQCAQMQLVYGGTIVAFLGAVHWGLAMNSATLAAAGTKAASALNERYVWSVVPALGAVPALLMPPAQGSFSVAVLLFICYLSDASYFRTGYLPSWYMTLRGYLTLIAMLGMLSTTAYYFKKDMAKAVKMIEEEDAKRLARLEGRAAAAGVVAAAAATAPPTAPTEAAAAVPPARTGRK